MSAQNEFFKALHIIASKARAANANDVTDKKLPESFCPECGSVIGEINDESVFGCPHCYDAAREQLKSIKNPELQESNRENEQRKIKSEEVLAELQHQLRTAIVTQDFERAAKLRDEINQTEKSISMHGGLDE